MYVILFGNIPFGNIPFDDEDSLNQALVSGNFSSDQFFNQISEEAKDLIKSMLKVDPEERISIEDALEHEWIINNGPQQIDESKSMNIEQDNIDLVDTDIEEKPPINKH